MYYKEQKTTPELASKLLATQIINRPIRTLRLNQLICEIQNGGLKTCPDPICIGVGGDLRNGQHRLTAILVTGKAQTLWFAYDVPEDAVIDRGLERSLEDSLYMRGMISKDFDKRVYASLAKRYLIVSDGKKVRSDSEYAEFITKYGSLMDKAIRLSQKGKHNPIAKKAGFQTAILAALIRGIDENELEKFCYVVNTGFAEGVGQSSAVILRQFIQDNPVTGEVAINRLVVWTETALRDFLDRRPRRNRYKNTEHFFISRGGDNED